MVTVRLFVGELDRIWQLFIASGVVLGRFGQLCTLVASMEGDHAFGVFPDIFFGVNYSNASCSD